MKKTILFFLFLILLSDIAFANITINNTKFVYNKLPLQDQINNLQNGGTIYLPRGIYQISTSLNIIDEIQLVGEGRENTIIEASPDFKGDYLLGNLSSTPKSHVKIQGITLDCNNRSKYGIYLNNTKFSLIQETQVFSCPQANIFLEDNNFYTKIEDITIGSGNTGILIQDNEVSIENARISSNIGINITKGNNILIEKSIFDTGGNIAIFLDHSLDTDIIAPRFEAYSTCLQTTINSKNTRLYGGRFVSCAKEIDDKSNSLFYIKQLDLFSNGIINISNITLPLLNCNILTTNVNGLLTCVNDLILSKFKGINLDTYRIDTGDVNAKDLIFEKNGNQLLRFKSDSNTWEVRNNFNFNFTGNVFINGLIYGNNKINFKDIIHITPLETAPSSCITGDIYVDTSGAYCACNISSSWENMLTTGNCE